MSFFSTTDVISSLVSGMSGDLVKSIINNENFKQGLIGFDINDYLSDEVIEDITKRILSNSEVKKQLRTMIIEILSDMNIKDEVDSE